MYLEIESDEIVFLKNSRDDPDPLLGIFLYPGGFTKDIVIASLKSSKDSVLISEQVLTINGLEATHIIVEETVARTQSRGNVRNIVDIALIPRDDLLFQIAGPDDISIDLSSETFLSILSTFKFIGEDNQQAPSWSWENLGCGSSAPCSYRVCSVANPETCYSCRGKFDISFPEGEQLPTKDENPLTTNNFICDVGFND